MKNFNIKIWTLSATLFIAFTCAYSQQGQENEKATKLKEKKEANSSKENKKLESLKEQKEKDIKEKNKKRDKTTEPKVKKDTPKVKDQPKPKTNKNSTEAKATKAKGMKDVEGIDEKHLRDSLANLGIAYGRYKESLEGKEFGQKRAEQSRLNKEVRKAQLTNSITSGASTVAEAREKITVAKENLEQDKKARIISEAEYQVKQEKIRKAEASLKELESKVEGGRKLVAQ
jgi:hypothetical protein